jgi:hypothetical protein
MKTIFVPSSRAYKATNALRLANYLATRSRATVELFPLEKGKAGYASYNEKTESSKGSRTFLSSYQQELKAGQTGWAAQNNQTADLEEMALPRADLIVMEAALVNGRYEIAADSEAEGTKGIYASGEFMMDGRAEGTKGACAAHELPLHPAVEELMKAAQCPVLTVVPSNYEIFSLKTVVLVTDGEQDTAPLFSTLSQLQRMFRFRLHLLHINRWFHRQNSLEVVNNMRELAKAHSLTGYQIHIIEDYTYEEGIIHFSQKMHPDMIALPVDGHKVISRLLEEVFSQEDATDQIKYLLTYRIPS